MCQRLVFCLFILLFSECIEPYEFVINNKAPALVIEGYISDVSYSETLKYPSNGRYFYVNLSYTSDVTNRRGEAVTGAEVSLVNDDKQTWIYSETDDGNYLLLDKDFRAMADKKYKLTIRIPNGKFYESQWTTMPDFDPKPVGNVSFDETTELTYKYVAQEKVIKEVHGIDVKISLPLNDAGGTVYYLWKFEPSWLFKAPLFPSVNETCWVTSDLYLSNYVLQEDVVGGYDKKLFFVETDGNERFLWDFSLLIKQFVVNKDYYQFMNDIKNQSNSSLSDALPYNLQTNLIGEDGSGVKGYFTVVRENALRWYFSQRDLSYTLNNSIKAYCEDPLSDKGPVCWDCMAYGSGNPSIEQPVWWRQ